MKWFSIGNREDPRNPQYFVIYRFAPKEKIDLNDPSKIPLRDYRRRPLPQRIEWEKIKIK